MEMPVPETDSEHQMSPSRQNPVPTTPHSFMLLPNSTGFCTEENITRCIAYINREVATLGLSELNVEPCRGGEGLQAVSALNLLHQLLQVDQRCLRAMDELQVQLLRSGSDLEHLRHSHTRLKDHLEHIRRENSMMREGERQLLLKIKTLQSCLKTEKEEVQKLQRIISSRATQYNHSAKKMERESTKLKEKVGQLLVHKNRDKGQAIIVANELERSDGKRSIWRTDRIENRCEWDMYHVLLRQYEARQRSLMVENAELRKVLHHMKEDMVTILSQSTSGTTPADCSLEPVLSEEDNEDEEEEAGSSSGGSLEQSCEQAREQLTASVRQHWRRLMDHVHHLDSQVSLAANLEHSQGEGAQEEELEGAGQLMTQEVMFLDRIESATSEWNILSPVDHTDTFVARCTSSHTASTDLTNTHHPMRTHTPQPVYSEKNQNLNC